MFPHGDTDLTVRLWDSYLARCVAVYQTGASHGGGGTPWDVSFAPFGLYFCVAMQNRVAGLFCTDHLTMLRAFAGGHSSDVTRVAWHPNMSFVLTASDDNTVRVWDVRTSKCVRCYQCLLLTGGNSGGLGSGSSTGGGVSSLAVSPCGTLFAAGMDGGAVLLFELVSDSTRQASSFSFCFLRRAARLFVCLFVCF